MRAWALWAAALCAALAVPAGAAEEAPVVATADGSVRGERDGEVLAFRGIPYAAPPVGDLRWRPPRPAGAWSGIRDAVRFAPHCPGAFPDRARMAEDCLYLNLWTAGLDAGAKRPVMVWIYGGGFRGGSAAAPEFDGAALARKGVVLVSFGYRTGPLGFLALPELTAESPQRASGNYGILDAVAALRWVQANVARFGGDPNNVTVFGHSSGSETVSILTASPLAKGLFHRAIGESGSSFGVRAALPLAEAEKAGAAFAARQPGTLADLRGLPWQALEQRESEKFEPTVDGWVLPESVRSIYRAGRQNDVAMMVGNTAQEFGRPPQSTAEAFDAELARDYGPLAGEVRDSLAEPDPTTARWKLTNAEWGDVPAATWSGLQATTGAAPVYRYLFDYAPPVPSGLERIARHGAELRYVFGTYRQTAAAAMGPADERMADLLSAYWVNFARSGDPNGPGLPPWRPVREAPGSYMRFTADGGAQVAARDPQLVELLGRHHHSKATDEAER